MYIPKLKHTIKPLHFAFVVFACCAFKAALPPPPDMWANTGAPGEVTCVSCHNQYPINSGGGYIKLSAVPAFTNGHYVPGQVYQVTATITQPSYSTYQCSVEIVDGAGNNAGAMAIIDSAWTYLETANTGRLCVWGGQYDTDTIFHCTFNWTAPQSGIVSLYTAGVVHGNQMGGATGYVYNDSLTQLTPGAATGIVELPEGKLNVFPNPVHSYLHLKYAGEPALLHFNILNANGTIIKSNCTSTGLVNVSDLPNGIFYIQYNSDNNKICSLRFVKE